MAFPKSLGRLPTASCVQSLSLRERSQQNRQSWIDRIELSPLAQNCSYYRCFRPHQSLCILGGLNELPCVPVRRIRCNRSLLCVLNQRTSYLSTCPILQICQVSTCREIFRWSVVDLMCSRKWPGL